MTDPRIALLDDLERTDVEIARLKTHSETLRRRIAAESGALTEGANQFAIEGVKISITHVVTRTIDREALATAMSEHANWPWDSMFAIKRELIVPAWKLAHKDVRHMLRAVVTEKYGLPQIKRLK